jgi:hypothetical protein
MKRILTAGLLMLAISTASFARVFVATGKTHTSLGDYKVEVADKWMTINNKEYRTYVISYENTPMEVKVVVVPGKKCKDFVVISDKLNVKYVCNKDYFGVEKLTEPLNGFTTSDETLNRTQYFHQRVLTSGGNTEEDNARMIAAFFPLLLNEDTLAKL